MVKTADVVVIGGGVNGCSTAYHLAKAGVKNVVLVEKSQIASGPTGLSSGIVRQYYTLEPLAMMARDSVRVLANFREIVGGDAGFVQCGIVFTLGPSDDALMRESVEMHQRIGIEEKLLGVDELKAMEPQINTDGLHYGAYEPHGGYADPASVANFKPEGRHGVMVGSLTEVEADRNVEIDTYAMKTSYDETVPYSEAILRRFPVMESGVATAGWAGLYDVTPDGVPVIGEIDEVKGFYCAVGWNGHGFKTSPALGSLMAELITTGVCARYDLEIFRYTRFREGKLTRSKSAYSIVG